MSAFQNFKISLAVLGCYWAVLIYQLGAQWSAYEQYNYGWAVPFLCAYLLWKRFQTADGRRQIADGRGPSSVLRRPPSQFQLSAFVLCAFLYLPIRWLHEANPIWRLTSWALALEVVGLTLLVAYALGDGSRQIEDGTEQMVEGGGQGLSLIHI